MPSDRDGQPRRKKPPAERGNVFNFRLGKLAVFGLLIAVVCITVLFSEVFLGTVEKVVPMLTAPVSSTIVRIKKQRHRKAPKNANPTPGGALIG